MLWDLGLGWREGLGLLSVSGGTVRCSLKTCPGWEVFLGRLRFKFRVRGLGFGG